MRQWLIVVRQFILLVLLVAAPFLVTGFLIAENRGLVVGAQLAALLVLFAWAFSRPILLRVCSAKRVSDGAFPQLTEAVQRLASVNGLRMPVVAVSALPIPNAMAAVTPGGGLVCVTEGLVGMLSPEELDAVLAHEIAHLTQRGRSGATIAAVIGSIPGAITAAAGADLYFELPYRRSQIRLWGGRRMHPLRDAVARLVAPLAAVLVRTSTTMASEFAADQGAARMIENPAALSSSLRKLQSLAGRIVCPINPAIAHLLVIHPFGCPRLGQIFDTHPPMTERLAALAERQP